MGKKKKRNNMQKRKDKPTKKRTLGNLEPKHRFFLNPYEDARFTRCPQCTEKTKVRKYPFGIHIDPEIFLILNMSGRYCTDCDLIILHEDKVETLMVLTFEKTAPHIIGNDYLILGTVERNQFHKASKEGGTSKDFFDNLHDFKEVVTFEPNYRVWLPDEKDEME